MKDPITLSGTTPYYEKHFMLIDETPHAYVSAFREAQLEVRDKRRLGTMVFWAVVLLSAVGWIMGAVHLLIALVACVGVWLLVSWRNRHEARLLAHTFELALEGKEREFHDYMWRHLDRTMLYRF